MPKSRSKRSTSIRPATPKPKPSPRWLPFVGVGCIIAGILLVLLSYLVPGLPGGNLKLFAGFAVMAVGLAVLTQWR